MKRHKKSEENARNNGPWILLSLRRNHVVVIIIIKYNEKNEPFFVASFLLSIVQLLRKKKFYRNDSNWNMSRVWKKYTHNNKNSDENPTQTSIRMRWGERKKSVVRMEEVDENDTRERSMRIFFICHLHNSIGLLSSGHKMYYKKRKKTSRRQHSTLHRHCHGQKVNVCVCGFFCVLCWLCETRIKLNLSSFLDTHTNRLHNSLCTMWKEKNRSTIQCIGWFSSLERSQFHLQRRSSSLATYTLCGSFFIRFILIIMIRLNHSHGTGFYLSCRALAWDSFRISTYTRLYITHRNR